MPESAGWRAIAARELPPMLAIAWPVVLAEIGWVLMGIVDTVIVAPLGPAAIGAVGTGSIIFMAAMVLGMGTMYALDAFVAQSHGAGQREECYRWLAAGLALAGVLSVVLVLGGFAGRLALASSGINPDVLVLLEPYVRALLWSVPLLLVFTVLRRYLQAVGAVRPVMIAAIAANIVNAVVGWVLVYGAPGLRPMGVLGSAYGTCAARFCLVVVLAWALALREPGGLRAVAASVTGIDWSRVWRLLRLGGPAAIQLALEVGVFATAAAMAGHLTPVDLAANQLVLNIASFFFMIPLGLSSAAAVRVGHAIGRGDPAGARGAGWTALGLALVCACLIATTFVAMPGILLEPFSTHEPVLQLGATLLMVCAVFQPFDGFQAVATGALRGAGDTHTAMVANLTAHWGIGLPLASYLCFWRAWGVVGLWSGLSLSIILVGSWLVFAWHRRSSRLERLV